MTPESVEKIINGYVYLHRVHQEITGSTKAGIMLSKACHYQEFHGPQFPDGFWYKTRDSWECEAGITKDEFYTARKLCTPFIDMEKRGSPAQTWYRVNQAVIDKAIEELKIKLLKECEPPGGYVGKADVVCRESRHRVCRESRRHTSGKPTCYIDQIKGTDPEVQDKRGSRVRAKAPKASDQAIEFVNAFRDRHPWYPRKLDPRQTARELSAAEFLLASSTQDEIFALVDRVLAGFVGNRRKVGMIKDLWDNFSALRVEYSETGGLTPEESARIAEISRNSTREKTEDEIIADWNDYVAYCASVGKEPDESSKPECLRRSKMPQDVLGGIDPHAAGNGL